MKRPANPAVKRLIDYFHDAHMRRHGCKPIIRGGKDGTLLRELLGVAQESEIEQMIDLFFSTRDRRVLASDYHIGAFYSLFPHLRLLRDGKRLDDRTASNLDAAARAVCGRMGRKQETR